jgi:uncharacterized glyoxalase superfamily protein PhnB
MDNKPNVSPVLRYEDAPAAITFLVNALGFEPKSDHRTPDGAVAHADLALGPSIVGVSSTATSSAGSPWAGVRQGVYLVVDNPDAYYERARAAGADVASPITDQDYGSRDFTLRDPEGHLWAFGTYDMSRGTGEPTIFPEIRYRDAAAAASWLERAIGFRRTLMLPGSDGSIMHAEFRLERGVLMIGARSQSSGEFADLTHFANLQVSNPDEHCARARAAGATIVREPQTAPYGARFYAARDSEGFLWWVSNYKPAK